MTCQAQEMAREEFGDEIEHCEGPRDMQRLGWWFCEPCTYSLDIIQIIADKLVDERGDAL